MRSLKSLSKLLCGGQVRVAGVALEELGNRLRVWNVIDAIERRHDSKPPRPGVEVALTDGFAMLVEDEVQFQWATLSAG
jgi:hypothetical protein